MSEEQKKISDVVIPSGIDTEQSTQQEGSTKNKNDIIRHDFVKQLKRAYIDYGIKINDDDPLIAVLIGQNVLIDLYEKETTKHIDSKFETLERALSTFPVRVSDELNERAENFLSMVEKIDNSAEKHLNDEYSGFQKRVSGYAQDTEKFIRKINPTNDSNPTKQISGLMVFSACFISSLLSVTIALVAFYYIFLAR